MASTDQELPNDKAASDGVPTLGEATRVWAKIGVTSFGGPAAQIALMHREVVETRGWLSEKDYLSALSFCMLLPGPEAMQLATYAGWRLHGTIGGLIAGLLFVLPGAFVILALAVAYLAFGDVPLVEALFLGVKSAVLVIVLAALLKISQRALQNTSHWILAALAFLALFAFDLPFPIVIVAAAVWGLWASRSAPTPQLETAPNPVPIGRTISTAATWASIWLIPLLMLQFFSPGSVFADIGTFFSILAAVTFGGAYAVLAYMAQEAVNGFQWLTADEMVDALGLAETTPGPLILVTEFVGFLAAARSDPSGEINYASGALGAVVTLWVTFAPCFLWVFVGAPYIERLHAMPKLKGALDGITAAVVGVILNLSIWFALQVAFQTVNRTEIGAAKIWLPEFATYDGRVFVLTALAAGLLLWLKRGVLLTLSICAAAGVVLSSLF